MTVNNIARDRHNRRNQLTSLIWEMEAMHSATTSNDAAGDGDTLASDKTDDLTKHIRRYNKDILSYLHPSSASSGDDDDTATPSNPGSATTAFAVDTQDNSSSKADLIRQACQTVTLPSRLFAQRLAQAAAAEIVGSFR